MNMKKAAALLLSLALAAGIVSAAAPRAKAADAAPYSSMQFYRNELTSYTGSAKQVVVPEGVETIGASAFQNNTALTSVSLPSTLKSIGAYAFAGCTGLTSVTLPASLTALDDYAFSGCTKLASVNGGAGVVTVGFSVFESTAMLNAATAAYVLFGNGVLIAYKGSSASIAVPAGVRHIAKGVFQDRINITSLSLPDGLITIGGYAFKGCVALGSVIIPASVTTIGGGAFYSCQGMTSALIRSGVQTIGKRAFSKCYAMTAVTIPASVTAIGGFAFQSTAWLDNQTNQFVTAGDGILLAYTGSAAGVIVPSSVKTIGYGAFYDNSNLTSVTIQNGVVNIDDFAFYYCDNLITVTFPPTGLTRIGANAFQYCSDLVTANIPSSVKTIGANAFASTPWYNNFASSFITAGDSILIGYKGTQANVTIPQSVKTVNPGVFKNKTTAVSVTVPASVTSVGEQAFMGCVNLASVTFNAASFTLGAEAFRGCTALSAVTLPAGVTDIGAGAFVGCTSLQSAYLSDGLNRVAGDMFNGCTSLTTVRLAPGTESIGSGAFAGCSSLVSPVLPVNEVFNEIGLNAFRGCVSVKQAVIPDNISKIGPGAFADCSSLESVDLGQGVASIGAFAFSGCPLLHSIFIGAGVASISPETFAGWTQLTIFSVEAAYAVAYAAANGIPCEFYSCIVSIGGYPAFGSILTAVIEQSSDIGMLYRFTWLRGGSPVGTGPTYYVRQADLFAQLQLKADAYRDGSRLGTFFSSVVVPGKGYNTAYPNKPVLVALGSDFVTLAAMAGYEYRIGNAPWQISPYFTGLAPFTEYQVYARMAETATRYAGPVSDPVWFKTEKRTITGQIAISGQPYCGLALTADTSGLVPAQIPAGGLAYEWFVNGVSVSTQSAYTVTAADVGKPVTLKISGAGAYTGSLTSAPVTAVKHPAQPPGAPELESATSAYIVLKTVAGREYKVEGGQWQTSGVFGRFKANTPYTFYARIAETATHQASEPGPAAVFRTSRIETTGAVTVTGSAVFGQTLGAQVTGLSPAEATYDIEWRRNGATVNVGNNYTLAQGDIGASITACLVGRGDYICDIPSQPVVPVKAAAPAPAAPLAAEVNAKSLMLAVEPGCEYKLGTGAWQASGLFTGLKASTSYTFYARTAETATHFASPSSVGAVIKTSAVDAVTNFTGQYTAHNSVSLAWTPVTGAAGYKVYRSLLPDRDFVTAASVAEAACVDGGLTTGTTYYYKVRPFTLEGGSEVLASASPVIAVTPLPLAPTGLTAASASYSSIAVAWQPALGAEGYQIYRYDPNFLTYVLIGASQTTAYTDTGLTPATVYYYKVKAYVVRGGEVLAGALSSNTSASPVLPAPSNLTAAAAGYDSINLQWQASEGASGYDIYRYYSGVTTYEFIAQSSSTSFTDTGLDTGTRYYYRVKTRFDSAGGPVLSAYSNTAAVTLQLGGVPSLQAQNNSIISVETSWGAVPGANGYIVERTTASSGVYTQAADTVQTAFTDTQVLPDVAYTYRVRAYRTVNGASVFGAYSPTATVTTVFAAPPSLSAVSASYNSAALSWAPVPGAQGYRVYISTSQDSGYYIASTVSATSYLSQGLGTGTTYYFKVCAYVVIGGVTYTGLFTPVVSVIPIPSAPASFGAVSASPTSLDLTWSSIAGASGYVLYLGPSADGPWERYKVLPSSATGYTDTGLETGRTRYYKVRAYRTVNGVNVYGTPSDAFWAYPMSDAPANLTAAAVSLGSVKVNWSAVAGAAGYNLYYYKAGMSGYALLTSTDSLSYTFSVTLNETYSFKAAAYVLVDGNRVEGLQSSTAEAVSVFSAPAGVSAERVIGSIIRVSWNAVPNAEGYEVYRSTSPSSGFELVRTTSDLSYTNSFLLINRTYYYKVRAYATVNGARVYSPYSVTVSATA